ncbi:MAG: UDP-N-acetylmuramoyl-L-alanine--D-glutamate ligase [Lachnospiraceae bacterium]|nr:UDP-N-acetylmuramoyl-L-alanine--D-glutamate ligase [Lachnospiraceae bacterium]
MYDFKDKNVLIIGSGKSGIAALSLLCPLGAKCILFDGGEKAEKEEVLNKIPKDLKCEVYVKELPEDVKNGIEVVVPSPGVPCDIGIVKEFYDKGIPVWGELELGYITSKGKLAAITGTNGKTTTTSLVGEICKKFYEPVFVVGNIGNPLTLEATKTKEEGAIVAEVSSFQLETINEFHPAVSAVLNVTPDHLNRHHTMECYNAVKCDIAKNQTKDDVCVLNFDNSYTREFGERCPAKVVWFSSGNVPDSGYYYKDDYIYYREDGKDERILNVHTDMNLVGVCNIENVMAAIAIGRGMGVPMNKILEAVKEFKAVEHRIEFVATKKGVDYYNDSKGTNPDAAIQGIKAMSKPTILIGGGYDKGNTYDEWIEAFGGKVKKLVLIGQTREAIAECAKSHGFTDYCFADTFEECFDICVKNAKEGDAVLLSPACASWGMFPNYEERGRIFKEMVNSL